MGKVNQPSNVLDRLVRLEREIAQVRKRVGLGNATISGGDLTVQGGGSFRVRHPNGTIVARVGNLGAIDDEDVWGVQFLRPDGSEALIVYGTESGSSTYVGMRDQAGNVIMSDDGTSGHGLATPYLTGLMAPSGTADNISACWPRTKKPSYEEILSGTIPATHPRLAISMTVATDGGTAGSARVLVNGTQVGDAISGGQWFDETVDVPGWGDEVHFLDDITITVQARVTSGTNNVYAMVYKLAGVQT